MQTLLTECRFCSRHLCTHKRYLQHAIVAQRINQGPDMSVARQIFLLESLYIQTLLTKGRLVLKESRMYWIARG